MCGNLNRDYICRKSVYLSNTVVAAQATQDVNTTVFEDFHELAFDMDAPVEQVPAETTGNDRKPFSDDVIDIDEYDNNDNDIVEISSVSELIARADTSTKQSEYSYGFLKNMNQIWAGPSYWKYRRNNRNQRKPTKIVEINNNGQSEERARKSQRKKTMKVPIFACIDENESENAIDDPVLVEPEENNNVPNAHYKAKEDDSRLFVPAGGARKSRKKSLQSNWSAKQLMLPTDHRIRPDLFEYLSFANSLRAGYKGWDLLKKEEKEDNDSDVEFVDDDIECYNDVDTFIDNDVKFFILLCSPIVN